MSVSTELQQAVGNYTIERPLANGSMGQVYVARHTLTHARVALKVLRADLTSDPQVEERFLREVRAAAHIGHDGIVKVYDAGRSSDGRLYLAMELLHGETLEERMQKKPEARIDAMDWLLRVLSPLAAAHGQGIVHRDLKPANVFIAQAADGREHIKLLDFGLARDTREKSGTQTGIAMGTPYYMSPEQATRPKEVGPASDIWSLGVMMYEVLSGEMPFDGETLHAIVIQSSTEAHVPLGERTTDVDHTLCELVDDCLSKDPEQRPADAVALELRLRPLLEDPAIREQLGEGPASHEDAPAETASALRLETMPFADTAISLSPRLVDSDVRALPRHSTRGAWLSALAASALAALALATFGFFWALEHVDGNNLPAPAQPPQANDTQPQTAPERDPDPATPSAQSEPNTEPASTENAASVEGAPAAAQPSAANANTPLGALEQSDTAARPSEADKIEPLPSTTDTLGASPSATPHGEPESITQPGPASAEPTPDFGEPDLSGIGQTPIVDPPEGALPPTDLPPPDPPEPSAP